MIPFFCCRCSEISFSVEGVQCSHCGNDEIQSAVAENIHHPVPELGNVSTEYYVPAIDAGNQKSEEDFRFEVPIQEASSVTTENDFNFLCQTVGRIGYENCTNFDNPAENKRTPYFDQYTYAHQNCLPVNLNTNYVGFHNQSGFYVPLDDSGYQKSGDFIFLEPATQTTNNDFNFPNLTVTRIGHENCSYFNNASENETSLDFHQYTSTNKNSLPATLTAYHSEFHNQSYDPCNLESSLEAPDDSHVASQEAYLCERSSIGEYENKYLSNEWLRRPRNVESTAYVNKVCKLDFNDSITFMSEYPDLTNFSENVEDWQEKGKIQNSLSSLPLLNPSINKYFQENLVSAKIAEQKPHTNHKLSKKTCEKCGKHFLKELTFYAHLQNNCNSMKFFKCGHCDETFNCISNMLMHERVHTGEKPFKCNQCDYASAWIKNLNQHMKKHFSEKPFKCDQCDYASAWKQNLRKHKKTHTTEKSFTCDQCDNASD